jgi:hypothetical protein
MPVVVEKGSLLPLLLRLYGRLCRYGLLSLSALFTARHPRGIALPRDVWSRREASGAPRILRCGDRGKTFSSLISKCLNAVFEVMLGIKIVLLIAVAALADRGAARERYNARPQLFAISI